MAVRRLNHAVLYVHGLQRTVDFYRTALGFEVRLEIPGRAAFLRAPGSANDHDLGLFEIGTGQAPDRPEHPGLYHLAWEVGTLADLADTREKLVQAGALVGESDHRVSKSLYARAGLGRRTGRWRDDRAARPGRRDRALGPGSGDRRRGRLPDLRFIVPRTGG
jgi:catechol-2,3-dioxygenase